MDTLLPKLQLRLLLASEVAQKYSVIASEGGEEKPPLSITSGEFSNSLTVPLKVDEVA